MHFKLITDIGQASVDLQERGLHYGDGLFETLLLKDGGIRWWDRHYQRLNSGAERLKIPCPTEKWLHQALEPYFDANIDTVLKIILTRGIGGRGLQMPERLEPTVLLLHYPYKPLQDRSLKVVVSDITLASDPQLAGIKHLNRLPYVLATESLSHRPGYAEAVLLDGRGHVIESIVHNLFFITDGCVHTPDLSLSGVAGIMRDVILETLNQMDISVKISHFSREDLINAEEVFLCNSVQGIRPVIGIENQSFPMGAITTQLIEQLNDASPD
jgi:4-amino-4-deoxychorismate lyase